MALWIGVDVGGTFTDIVGFNDATGQVSVHKTASTPGNPAEAMVLGIAALIAKMGVIQDGVREIAHGTTVGTNALIQRKGARAAMITTSGFRDLLEIGFQNRQYVYDLHRDMAAPLVARPRRFETAERITTGGTVVTPLTDGEIDRVVEAAAAVRADAYAVCFLFSYQRSDHEQRMGAALARRFPDAFVSLSSEVQPEFREYQRFSTTVLNAYLQPVMSRYLAILKDQIARDHASAGLYISHSNGGLMDVDTATKFPIRTAMSGPAAGVAGAVEVVRRSGRTDAVTFDMGGTSTDVAMIRDGAVGHTYGSTIGGYPIRLPMVDVVTVGAGGGSIAWFGADDLLKVGPVSAGATPGPACYSLGGAHATVTDANLVLGRLPSSGLLGGAMALSPSAAHAAIVPIADRLGVSVVRAALGILDIVVSNMVRAIRTISVERGYDPRDVALLPFGGGGPLHGRAVATELGMKRIVVPSHPGLLCAAGLMTASLVENFVATLHRTLDEAGRIAASQTFGHLMRNADRWFTAQSIPPSRRRCEASLDLSYEGQSFELSVPLPSTGRDGGPAMPPLAEIRHRFLLVHERAYGYSSQDDPIVVVNCRLRAIGLRLGEFRLDAADADPVKSVTSMRPVWFVATEACPTPVLDRGGLGIDTVIDGPAVIEQYDSTVLLFPGDRARVDAARNLIIEIAP